jgi:hypothetical protein
MEEILVFGEPFSAGTQQGGTHRLKNKDRRYPNAASLRMHPQSDVEVKTPRYVVGNKVTGDEGEQCH